MSEKIEPQKALEILNSIYPWAHYLAMGIQGEFILHKEKPEYKGSKMRGWWKSNGRIAFIASPNSIDYQGYPIDCYFEQDLKEFDK